MIADEGRALARAVLCVLQAAFPFEHRPAVEPDRGQPGEDRLEIDLPVAERAEAAGAVDPGLEAGIDALPTARIKLGILDMEGADPLRVDIDEVEVVELLQHEVRGIVIDGAARVVACALQEYLEGDAVADVLAGMDLETEIDAGLLIRIQDRTPAPRQLVEGGLDHSWRPLRPRIDEWPGPRAGETHAAGEAEPARGLRDFDDLIHRPGLTVLRAALDRRRRK